MAMISKQSIAVRDQVSADEWRVREELAAAYRLVAHFRWDDLIFTHLSARVPGPEHHFLLNPYELMFEEITASSLVKIDVESSISPAHALWSGGLGHGGGAFAVHANSDGRRR